MPVYINKDGKQSGPYEDHVVIDRLRSGALSPNDLGIRHGSNAWEKLGDMFPGVGSSSSGPPPVASAGSVPPMAARLADSPSKSAGGCRKPLGWIMLVLGLLMMLGGVGIAVSTPYVYSTLSCDMADRDKVRVDDLMKKYEAAKGTDEELEAQVELESELAGFKASNEICSKQRADMRWFQVVAGVVAVFGFFMLVIGFFVRRV